MFDPHSTALSGNKIHFVSLGCPRNLVDSEVMLGILLQAGYEVTTELNGADFLIVNTCGFLEASRKESSDTIDHLLKQCKKGAKVIATGCMVQKNGEELKKQFPNVHYFLGSGDAQAILTAVRSEEQGSAITSAKSFLEAGEIPRTLSTPKHYAYLKIAEGCRKGCAYCIIPQIKGPLRSKQQEQILKEFKLLLERGVKEIILIAQDLGDYGKDQGKQSGLIEVLRAILAIEGDYWLRLLYLYPDEITPELIELMRQDRRICPYLDMPIQHINNAVLKAMRRKTSREQIISILTTLREQVPNVSVRTSLIVGFPGETEEQFEELCQFVKEHPLENIGVFKYSKEAGSPAAKMDGHIDPKIKERRYKRLMSIQREIVRKRNRAFIGKRLRILVDGRHPESELLFVGRHAGQCPEIDGQIIINDARKLKQIGGFHEVEITDVADYDLIGRIVHAEENAILSKSKPNSALKMI